MDGYPVHSTPNYDFLSGNGYLPKQLAHSNSDGDSSSTKSEQSLQDFSAVSDSSLNGQHAPIQSDKNDCCGMQDQSMIKSVLSLGNPEAAFSSQKFDYSQSFACVSYPYAADSYYGGILNGFASNANAHPQINGTANSRVPLHIEPATEGPIFVNSKQYRAILRRRQARAKLEAQNKLVKVRKPYLHESRHRHAMKRARGSGGRFLNKKELQEQQQKAPPSLQTPTGGVSKFDNGGNLCTESMTSPLPLTPTDSGISSVSNGGDILAHQEHISFSSTNFFPSMNLSTQNGGEKMAFNGVCYHAPTVRSTASILGR